MSFTSIETSTINNPQNVDALARIFLQQQQAQRGVVANSSTNSSYDNRFSRIDEEIDRLIKVVDEVKKSNELFESYTKTGNTRPFQSLCKPLG